MDNQKDKMLSRSFALRESQLAALEKYAKEAYESNVSMALRRLINDWMNQSELYRK